jgi:hypothetical protein
MTTEASATTRRALRFDSIEAMRAELDRIERASAEGCLATTGRWTAGQILSHLAAWIEYGWDGYPVRPPSIFIRWVMKLMLTRILSKGMPTGVKIPGVEGGTLGQDDAPIDDALPRLRRALQRLDAGEPAKFDSPAFGGMSHEKRVALNLRHAELHLSFLRY